MFSFPLVDQAIPEQRPEIIQSDYTKLIQYILFMIILRSITIALLVLHLNSFYIEMEDTETMRKAIVYGVVRFGHYEKVN